MPGLTAEAPVRAVGRYQLDIEVGQLIPAERAARGKAARAQVPRDNQFPARQRREIVMAAVSRSDVFDRAIAKFAAAYADQNERDYQALTDAVKSGRITAEHGL